MSKSIVDVDLSSGAEARWWKGWGGGGGGWRGDRVRGKRKFLEDGARKWAGLETEGARTGGGLCWVHEGPCTYLGGVCMETGCGLNLLSFVVPHSSSSSSNCG